MQVIPIVLFGYLITNEFIRSFISSNVGEDLEVADSQDPKDLIKGDATENVLELGRNSVDAYDVQNGGIDILIDLYYARPIR